MYAPKLLVLTFLSAFVIGMGIWDAPTEMWSLVHAHGLIVVKFSPLGTWLPAANTTTQPLPPRPAVRSCSNAVASNAGKGSVPALQLQLKTSAPGDGGAANPAESGASPAAHKNVSAKSVSVALRI